MMENKVMEKFKKGVPTIGTITHMKSANAVEILGVTGLDYVLIDMEHCPVGIDEVNRYISAADAAQITPLVRIPGVSRNGVLRALDAGARGIIVPCVETVEQVKALVEYAKFALVGQRGYCMTRDGKWGYGDSYAGGMKGYMDICNQETMLLPQCETMGCLEHIEKIMVMDGVDGVLVGPYDLSIAMGLDGQFDHPDFKKAVGRILQTCMANGKLAMAFTGNLDDAAEKVKGGFDSVLYGIDILCVAEHYQKAVGDFMKAVKRSEREDAK